MDKELGFFTYHEGTPSEFEIGPDKRVQKFLDELRQYLSGKFTIYNEETDLEISFSVNQSIIQSASNVIENIHTALIRQNISMKWPKVNPLAENEIDIHWYDEIGDILLNVEDASFYYSAKLRRAVNDKRIRRKGGEDQNEAIAGITSFCGEYYPENDYTIRGTFSIEGMGSALTFATITETPSSRVAGFSEPDVATFGSKIALYSQLISGYVWAAGSNYRTGLAPDKETYAELKIVDD